MASIRKEVKPDGTLSSATSIILGRTFGNILVQAALVLLMVLWTIPTAGLLVSSFRTPNAIRETGWWSIVAGSTSFDSRLSFEVAANDDDAIAPGGTLTVPAEDSDLLADAVAGWPMPSVGEFSVNTITGQATVETLGEPIELPNIGTVTITEVAAVELDGEGDYTLFAMNDFGTISPDDLPYMLNYDIRAVREQETEGTVLVETFGEPVTIAGIGTLSVNGNSTYEFTPADGFNGVFEPDMVVAEALEAPAEISYEVVTGTVETITGEVEIESLGEPVSIGEFGTISLVPSADVAFESVAGYDGFFVADIDEIEETPFEFEYQLSGERLISETLTVDRTNIAETVPRIGQIIVFDNGQYAFNPRGNFVGQFSATIPENLPDRESFEISYQANRDGGALIEGTTGEPTEVTGVGTLTISDDGGYQFTASETFNGEVDLSYEIVEALFTLSNYDFVLFSDGMGAAFLNSLTITIPATIIPISIAAFAAYAFSWMEFPGRRILFVTVVGLQVVPLHLALIPMLRVYTSLGINGTFLALWLAHTGFGMPLAIFLLRNYIGNLPRELIESASIDGASHFVIFIRLILPLSVPALAAFAIFQFLWVWNDLIVALVFLGNRYVVTSRLSEMVGSRGQDWHVLTAGAFISMSLPLIVFFSLQRYFVRGLLAGSVKGG
jgi:alpha-glucoside transport system permease protein